MLSQNNGEINISNIVIVNDRNSLILLQYLKYSFLGFSKGNTMSNQQQGSNEAPKAAPTETKPAPQQNQGDAKQGSKEPAQQK